MPCTRSGRIYSTNGCRRCHRFYNSPAFSRLCSRCFIEAHPEKADTVLPQPSVCRSRAELAQYTQRWAVPSSHPAHKHLKFFVSTGAWKRFVLAADDSTAVINILTGLARHGYLGISAKQGAELYAMALGETKATGLVHAVVNRDLDWRLQHLICGLIVDWWNISSAKHGGVGHCYYAAWGETPRKCAAVRGPGWKRDFQLVTYHGVHDENLWDWSKVHLRRRTHPPKGCIPWINSFRVRGASSCFS